MDLVPSIKRGADPGNLDKQPIPWPNHPAEATNNDTKGEPAFPTKAPVQEAPFTQMPNSKV